MKLVLYLKAAIDELLLKHALCIKILSGQGYNGPSNMRGEFPGLKTLIIRENESV